jgi:hypothetical protein
VDPRIGTSRGGNPYGLLFHYGKSLLDYPLYGPVPALNLPAGKGGTIVGDGHSDSLRHIRKNSPGAV